MDLANQLSDKFIVNTALSRRLKPSFSYSYPVIDNYIPAKYKDSLYTVALIHTFHIKKVILELKLIAQQEPKLMQLMFTARKVAKDLKIKYYKSALTKNPKYNIILGTTYINEMLIKFNKAFPLALAAYNAGPGSKDMGIPGLEKISYID